MTRQPRLPLEPRMRDSGVDKRGMAVQNTPRGVPPVREVAESLVGSSSLLTAPGEPPEDSTMQFWKIPVTVASRTDLNPIDKLVYSYLMDKQGGNGSSWPSLSTISIAIGSKERTVRRSCQNLKKYGLVTEKLRSGTSSLWTVITPDENDPSPICQSGQNVDHPTAKMAGHPGQKGGDTPAKMAAYSDSTRSIEPDLVIHKARPEQNQLSEAFDERCGPEEAAPPGPNHEELNKALGALGLRPYGMLPWKNRNDIDATINECGEHNLCFQIKRVSALPVGHKDRNLKSAMTAAKCAASQAGFDWAKSQQVSADQNRNQNMSKEQISALFKELEEKDKKAGRFYDQR